MQYLREKPRAGTQLNLSHPLNRGLVGCWLFNEGSGIRAFDSSPYKNHGTLLNMAIPSCRSSQGLAFDGVNDYVDCGNAASLKPTNITLEAWIYMPSLPPGTRVILGKQYNVGGHASYSFVYRTDPNRITFTIGNSVPSETNVASTNMQAGVWQHWVGTYDGINVKLYLNGNIENTVAEPNPIAHSDTYNFMIARYIDNYFNGSIDEVRIYNRALNATEIQLLYMNPYDMFMNVHGEL